MPKKQAAGPWPKRAGSDSSRGIRHQQRWDCSPPKDYFSVMKNKQSTFLYITTN